MPTVRSHSRLRFTSFQAVDTIEFWGLLEIPVIPEQPDDILYRVSGRDRIDTLAFRFYQDSVLWWVIATANNMEIVPTDLNEGDTIRIPSPRFILEEFFDQKAVF